MIDINSKIGKIATHNHLAARLSEGTQAQETTKLNRMSLAYVGHSKLTFMLFKHLANSGTKMAEVT